MTLRIRMSQASLDKMHACLSHLRSESDYQAAKSYFDACVRWWDLMTADQKQLGLDVVNAYSVKHPKAAEKLAAALPAAPKYPL